MKSHRDRIIDIILDFLNSDSSLKEVPSDYVICISDPNFPNIAKSLSSSSTLNKPQIDSLNKILLVNEILNDLKNDNKDEVEEKLIDFCREFIELMGHGVNLR